jgi:hypothetical protein
MISRLRLQIAQRLQIARRFWQPLVPRDDGDAKQPLLVFLSFRRAAAEGREVSL